MYIFVSPNMVHTMSVVLTFVERSIGKVSAAFLARWLRCSVEHVPIELCGVQWSLCTDTTCDALGRHAHTANARIKICTVNTISDVFSGPKTSKSVGLPWDPTGFMLLTLVSLCNFA